MLSKPKLTILSVIIVAMLLAVPMINAFDDVFSDYSLYDPIWTEDSSLVDPIFSNGIEYDNFAFSGDSYDYDLEYSDSEDLYLSVTEPDYNDYDVDGLDIDDTDAVFDGVNNNNHNSASDSTASNEDDGFLWDNPFEDPMTFDDPFDVPGDDIQDIGDNDIPPAPTSNPEPIPGPGPVPTINENGLNIQITGTRMQSEINPGEQLMLKIFVKNNGKEKIEDMKIVLVNQDLALRDSIGPMDLKRGAKASKTLLLDFPEGIEPGYYYLRINVHASGIDRVIYRDILVE